MFPSHWDINTRGRSQMTSAKFSGFLTPPSPCQHFGPIYSTKIRPPPLLHQILGNPLPPPSLLTSFVNGPLYSRTFSASTMTSSTLPSATPLEEITYKWRDSPPPAPPCRSLLHSLSLDKGWKIHFPFYRLTSISRWNRTCHIEGPEVFWPPRIQQEIL